uniref:Lipase n=1 Tax=Mesocestoides corti TaxID=53468 RepID=A0A5K3EFP0_MESCO
MLMLSYSNELEKLADALAAKCMPISTNIETQPEYKGLGHVSVAGITNKHLSFSVFSQIKERKPLYDCNMNSFEGQCYDYKQASDDL